MKPRILAWVPLCEYERWSMGHALAALAAVDAAGFVLDVVAHVQTPDARWEGLERLAATYPHRLETVYWWGRDVATGPAQHERLAGITASRNVALAWARRNRYDGLWFVDADVLVPAAALARLWALDRPLTSGVFHATDEGHVPYVFMRDRARAEWPTAAASADYDCHFVRWLPDDGWIDADFTGNGCLLWRGAALASDLTYRHGWREQDGRYWAEDPYTLLDALDRGLGPVRVDCGLRCWHTHPGGLAYGQHDAIPVEWALDIARGKVAVA